MQINGNLVFNSDSTGELQNAYIERLSTAPAFNSSEKGRIYFNTATALYYFNDGTAWQPFATGGSATVLASVVANVEAALGSVVTQSTTTGGGTFQSAAFVGYPLLAGQTSITGALQSIAAAAYGHELLSELGDVTLGSLSNNQFLVYSTSAGNKWINHTLVLADVSDVTALAADVNLLAGAAAGTGSYASAAITSTDLSYLSGATSNIQTQLNGKQPLNTGLTQLSSFLDGSGTGIVVKTGVDTVTNRTLVAPASGMTISDADGVAGNPTFAFTHNLLGIEGLAGTGFISQTGSGTFVERSILSGTVANIVVTNGDGVAGSPTIDLATVPQTGTPLFQKMSSDTYGRVTSTSLVTQSDITGLTLNYYLATAGSSPTGSITFAGTSGVTVTGLPAPVNASDAANKSYVDAAVAGLTWKDAVQALSSTNVTVSAPGTTIDGYTLASGDRVLLTNQTTTTEDGIWVFNGAAAAMTRPADAATFAQLDGAAVYVIDGTTYKDTGWVQGVDHLTTFAGQQWIQFSGTNAYIGGTGISIAGNVINAVYGAGITANPTGDIGIQLYSEANSALILTTNGTSRSDVVGAGLALLLASGSGLTQSSAGLYISAAGVTNAMLVNSTITLDVTGGGTGSIALGGTLSILGTATQGISSSISGSTITLTVADASSSQKGVASFTTPTFAVTAGNVDVASAGITNTMLANPSWGVSGTTGGVQQIALGTTLSIVGGTSPITTVSSAGSVAINVASATTTTLGLASFSATDFSVTAGAVSLVAKGLNSLTDVATSGDVAGQTLVYSTASSKFVNRAIYFLYTGSSNTTHTVVHNLGQMYCNVTVVDATDEVVIPQSITFNSTTQLTVTFNSAIACKVVVMGVSAA